MQDTAAATEGLAGVTVSSKLIPRRVAFRDPDRAGATLSHDGLRLAWLEPRAGVLNLFVSPTNNLNKAEQVTYETTRSLMPVLVWARTDRHVIIFRDQEGDENYRAFSVNVQTGAEIPLTPVLVKALYWGYSTQLQSELLFGINVRDRRFFDLVRVDVTTGARKLVFENPGFSKLHVDSNFLVRFGERVRADGSVEMLQRQPDGEWAPFLDIPAADALTTRFERLSVDGRSAFLLDSRGRDTVALFELDLASGTTTLLAEDPEADISDVVYHPGTERPLAAVSIAARQRWHPIDNAFYADIECLRAAAGDAEIIITGISQGMDSFLVFVERSDAAGEFRLYERRLGNSVLMFKNRFDLDTVHLLPMLAITIPASDGLRMSGYLTLPDEDFLGGAMVLAVHGGPYDRDFWGYSAIHQWLASRGYAVLSVNFRGSTGFGKEFTNAADKEWGGRMQDDLTDAVAWAIDHGYADPARVGFFGVSYGGYAALMAAARTPKKFACFIDAFGPSNLITFMRAIPPYWQTWFAMIKSRLADPDTQEGASWLAERSPLTHVGRIVRPMLIVQGLHDVRVQPHEAKQIVQALQDRGVPVIYVTFSDEGHFFARQQNRIAFSAVTEAFLALHLGGAMEPIGDDFMGSSIRVEVGQELISDFM